jgi:hypothetical protein
VSQDGPIPSAARPEPSRPRRCLDEPLSPLVLSHFQLACRSQRHPCRRHRCLLGSPTRTWLSFRTRRRGLEHLQLAPLSFSLACGCALPSSLFSPAPVSPCASRTRHGWPRRTRIITIGPFPPCGATGDVGSARGRKRGGIEAVRWGSLSTHRPPVIVQSCTWYCLTMRHFPGWPRRTLHPQSVCAHPVFLMTLHGRVRRRGVTETVGR